MARQGRWVSAQSSSSSAMCAVPYSGVQCEPEYLLDSLRCTAQSQTASREKNTSRIALTILRTFSASHLEGMNEFLGLPVLLIAIAMSCGSTTIVAGI